jgi:hypothetical protein
MDSFELALQFGISVLVVACPYALGLLWLSLRVETVGKIFGNSGFIFSFFLVIFILFGKYDNRYENNIWCRGNQSEYG